MDVVVAPMWRAIMMPMPMGTKKLISTISCNMGSEKEVLVAVDWTEEEAMWGNDRVVIAVVDRAHVETVGSKDAVVVGRDTEDEAACSMSIGGTGSKGALNSCYKGFFKASRGF
uniref:Uncharacterized protein n=1 Tax=Romanomermis culicivorax TaxID=13658 RepID=A0A915I5B4_ROMCU